MVSIILHTAHAAIQCVLREKSISRRFKYQIIIKGTGTSQCPSSFSLSPRNYKKSETLDPQRLAIMWAPRGCLLQLVELGHHVVLAADNDVLVLLESGTGRNQVTADHVLLQTLQVVDAGADGGLAEYLGGLLE